MEGHHQQVHEAAQGIHQCRALADVEEIVRVGIGGEADQSHQGHPLVAKHRCDGDLLHGPVRSETEVAEDAFGIEPGVEAVVVGVIVGEVQVSEPGVLEPRRQPGWRGEGIAVRRGLGLLRRRGLFAGFGALVESLAVVSGGGPHLYDQPESERTPSKFPTTRSPLSSESTWAKVCRPLSGGIPSGRVRVPRLMSPVNASRTETGIVDDS